MFKISMIIWKGGLVWSLSLYEGMQVRARNRGAKFQCPTPSGSVNIMRISLIFENVFDVYHEARENFCDPVFRAAICFSC